MAFTALSRTKPEKMISRFVFPGLSFQCRADTATEEVDVGHYLVGTELLCIELSRKSRGRDKRFSVRAIYSVATGRLLWKAVGNYHYWFCEVSGQTVIVCLFWRELDVGSEAVEMVKEVIPLANLIANQPSSSLERLLFKKSASQLLGCQYVLTADEFAEETRQEEERLLAVQREADEHARALQAALSARMELARQVGADKYLAKVDRIKAILNRGKIQVATITGVRLRGIPVTKDEWECLPHDTQVVLVSSFDAATGDHGSIIEHFTVGKTGSGKCKKLYPKAVVSNLERRAKVASTGAVTYKVLVQDGEVTRTVIVFKTMDDIRQAQKGGLNNRSLVAREEGNSAVSGKLEVFQVESTGITNYGHLPVVQSP